MSYFKKLKELFVKTVYISEFTYVKNKTLRILVSILLANLSVAFDILIIITFSNILIGEIDYQNSLIINSIEFIDRYKFLFPLLVIFRFLFLFIEKTNLEFLALNVQQNLKNKLIQQVFSKKNMSTSDIYYYVNVVSVAIGQFYKSFSYFLNYFFQSIVYSIFLFITKPDLFVIFIFAGLFIIAPTKYFVSRGKKYQHISFIEDQALNKLIQRIVDNLFIIKILSTIDKELLRFQNKTKNFINAQKYNNVFGGLNSIFPSMFTILVLSVILVSYDVSNLISLEFIAILIRLFQSLGLMNNGVGLVLNSSVYVEELYKFNEQNQNINKESYLLDSNYKNVVEFENVGFKYFNSDEEIFQNLNLKFANGKHTIITGTNGSGKSTLLGMIAGLYTPSKGLIKLNTSNIGYVGVTPLVFEGTIKENLLYGNMKKIDDRELLEILNEFSFFNEEEISLEYQINNKTLSSGQLQKISFMRSLLNDTKLLLLDESTANIDSASKNHIKNILKNRKITVINCTHNIEDFDFDERLTIDIENGSRRVEKLN
jgi:ABC-type multidrug transport system fused ATPase/permease subunit